MEVDGYNITPSETVKIGYRLNNDEGATFVTLGTYTANQGVLWFDEAHVGVPFKTVQFEITLNRRAASNENPTVAQMTEAISRSMSFSPELKALILLFDKKPLVRTAWTARIDVSTMVSREMDIDGESVQNIGDVWQKLKSMRDQPTLIKMRIPSLEGNVNVRIADMPISASEWKNESPGVAFVDLQLLEPVSR